jgi:hypothetical protein
MQQPFARPGARRSLAGAFAFAILAMAMGMGGCMSVPLPHHALKAYGGYATGMTLRTVQPIAVVSVGDGMEGAHLALVATRRSSCCHAVLLHSVSANDISQYCGAGSRCRANSHGLEGLIPMGTLLTIGRIEQRHALTVWYGPVREVTVYVRCASDACPAARLAEVNDLSLYADDDISPDPEAWVPVQP